MGNAKGYLFIFPFLFLVSAAIANIAADIAVPDFDMRGWRTAAADLLTTTNTPGGATVTQGDVSMPGGPARQDGVSDSRLPQDTTGNNSGGSGFAAVSTVQQLEDDFSFYVFFTIILALAIALLIIGFVRRSLAERFKS
jgi:hypothetical protein